MQCNSWCIYFRNWVISVSAAADDITKSGEAVWDWAASKIATTANPNVVTLFTPTAPQIAGATENQFPFNAINPPQTTIIADINMLTIIQVLTLDVRTAKFIPLPGEPLYVGPPEAGNYALQYQGRSVATLDEENGVGAYFAGVVWHAQPRQSLVHRELLQIAVCTQGACRSKVLSAFAGDIVGSQNTVGQTVVTRLSDDDLIFLMQ